MGACTELFFYLMLFFALVSSVNILNSIADLNASGFGQPKPRHGLELLSWFAKNCVDNNMKSTCNPQEKDYGFHEFDNKKPKSLKEPSLPNIKKQNNHNYYTLGNLNAKSHPKAENLPSEIRGDYDKFREETPNKKIPDNFNEDRIIINYNKKTNDVKNIYVSAHYDENQTYGIAPQLIHQLRGEKKNNEKNKNKKKPENNTSQNRADKKNRKGKKKL